MSYDISGFLPGSWWGTASVPKGAVEKPLDTAARLVSKAADVFDPNGPLTARLKNQYGNPESIGVVNKGGVV